MSSAQVKKLTKMVGDLSTRVGKKNKNSKGQRSNKRRAQRTAIDMSGSSVLNNHWNMLRDPCSSAIGESAYRGAAGIPSRFTRTFAVNAPGSTAFYYVGNPAALAATNNPVATSATAFTPVYNQAGAGQTFIAANASAVRVIGYCLTVDYLGTELNRSGKLYTGCVPSKFVTGGVATTIDAIKSTLSDCTRTPDHSLESKWFPGVQNEEYALYSDIEMVFSSGNNSLVVLAENMPDGVQLEIKETIIVEWQPLTGLGFVAAPAVGGTNPVAAVERLHGLAHNDPSFFAAFRTGASTAASKYAHAAGRGFVDLAAGTISTMGRGIARNAMRSLPLLLGA
jgi:hypothetical protein